MTLRATVIASAGMTLILAITIPTWSLAILCRFPTALADYWDKK